MRVWLYVLSYWVALFLAVSCPVLNAAEQTQRASVPGSQSRVVQIFSKAEAGQGRQEAIVEGDYSFVVQVIGDIPPKQLQTFLQDATDRQALAQKLGLTEKALQVFIQSTIDAVVPLEAPPAFLCSINRSAQLVSSTN